MEKRFKISDFAALVGTSPKTIYKQIEKGGLVTVNEVQNGRNITVIVTDDEQINEFKNMYGKLPVNEGNYEDILTVSEGEYTVNEVQNQENQYIQADNIKELITMNNNLQERLITVNERLITAESKQLLLEDKASREGLYINEINELKKENKRRNLQLITASILFVLLFFVMGAILMYQHFNPKKEVIEKEKQVIKVITVDHRGNVKSILTK